jgi:predicted ribosome quality control (RQC) complex YloA/Tae2 family protein
MDISPVFAEIVGLQKVRLQDIWAYERAVILELYTRTEGRLYLIVDVSNAHPTCHVQAKKPLGTKIQSPLILAARKHAKGMFLTFSLSASSYQTLLLHNNSLPFLSFVFDFSLIPSVGLFIDKKLIACSTRSTLQQPQICDIKIATSGIAANLIRAEAYAKHNDENRQLQAFNVQKQRLKQELKKLSILKKNLYTDLDNFNLIISHEKEAELLRLNLHKFKKGDTEVALTDYSHHPPKQALIKIDPRLHPAQLLEKIFTKIKKAKRGINYIKPRLDQLEKNIAELRQNLTTLQNDGPEAINIPLTPNASIKIKNIRKERLPYRVFISRNNISLWVSRSARDADNLTLHHTRGKEWWFHIRDGTGAHVIVKNSNDILEDETIIDASLLAAHFSSRNKDHNVEIIYTRIKNIRKPKGFAPGKFLVEQEKSFIVHIDSTKIQQLLEQNKIL